MIRLAIALSFIIAPCFWGSSNAGGGGAASEDDEGGAILINRRVTGAIDDNSDADLYQFRGRAGETIRIEVNATSGGLDPAATIFLETTGLIGPTPSPSPPPAAPSPPVASPGDEQQQLETRIEVRIDSPTSDSLIPIPIGTNNDSTGVRLTGRTAVTGTSIPGAGVGAVAIEVIDRTGARRTIPASLLPDGTFTALIPIGLGLNTVTATATATDQRVPPGTDTINVFGLLASQIGEAIQLVHDDNSGVNGGALIRTLRLPISGVYSILVASARNQSSGGYELKITPLDVESNAAGVKRNDGSIAVYDTAQTDQQIFAAGAQPAPSAQILRYSPDGRTVAVARFDNAVEIWSLREPNRPLLSVGGSDTSPATFLGYAATGDVFAIRRANGQVSVFNASDLAQPVVQVGDLGTPALFRGFAPDGAAVAIGRSNGSLAVYSTRQPNLQYFSVGDLNAAVTFIGFAPDGSVASISRSNGAVTVYSLRTPMQIVFEAQPQFAAAAVFRGFAPSSNAIAISRTDGSVEIWSTRNQNQRLVQLGPNFPAAFFLAFAPDGETGAVRRSDGSVELWSARNASQRIFTTAEGQAPPTATFQSFAPDGESIAVGRGNGAFEVWSTREINRRVFSIGAFGGQSAAFQGYAPNGATVALLRGSGAIELYSALTAGGPILSVPSALFRSFSPDGEVIAIARNEGTIAVYSAKAPGQQIFAFGGAGASNVATFQAFAPDSRSAFMTRSDGSFALYSTRIPNQQIVLASIGTPFSYSFLGFSPLGEAVAVTPGDGSISVYSARVPDQLIFKAGGPLPTPSAQLIEFSPNSETVAVSRISGEVEIYSTRVPNQRVLVFGGANTQSALLRAYSLDGEAIAFSRNDGAVAVFNLLRPGAPVFLVGATPSPTAFFSGFSFDRGRGAVTISSASFGPTLAKEMIVSAFGASLANGTAAAITPHSLPTELAGTRVFVNGVEAPLLYVSPQQVNFLIPAATAEGMATISILSGDGTVSVGRSMIARVAPGIFTANQDGTGLAAANIVRVASGGAQTTEPVVQWDGTKYVPVPIDLGPEGEIVVLVLFGTGIRYRTPGGPVTATIGGQAVQVDYAGPQNFFAGLDQVNIPLPRSLAGRGDVTVALSVDGVAANPVQIRIK